MEYRFGNLSFKSRVARLSYSPHQPDAPICNAALLTRSHRYSAMPGPGKTKGKKSKSKSASTSGPLPPDAYIGDIDNAVGWHLVIDILCDVFELPDLTTRSGLRKVHANFESVYTRLDTAYTRYSDNDKLAGGIVGIFAKMCSDAILRNKLISKGFLDKILPLLERPACRHVALQALGNITHHGGKTVRTDLAKQAPILLKVIKEHIGDPKTTELAITSLAHSVSTLVSGDHPIPVKTLQTLHIPKILEATVDSIKQPNSSKYLVTHGMDLISSLTYNASPICKANGSAIDFLVAGLRSQDWVFRCTCLGGLLRLHRHEAEEDPRLFDPYKLLAAVQRKFPSHISDVMVEYGAERTETYKTLKAAGDSQRAIMTCAHDRNLYSLGLKLANLILYTEFAVPDGCLQSPNPVTGEMETLDVGLPFIYYVDSLPHCAKAIRERGKREESDLADVLDIKFHITRARLPTARELAKKALERSPDYAYFYYPTTLSADNVEGLRAAKKGLKCKRTTHFLRFQLLQRAVEHAGALGLNTILESSRTAEKNWEEGIAFLMSAYEDAKTYVEEGPPDNRYMKNVLYWTVILAVTIHEKDISPDLREVQGYLERLKLADEISVFLSIPPPKTDLRLTMKTIIERFSGATKEFGEVIAEKTAPKRAPEPVSADKAGDDLAAWLENLRVDDGSEEPAKVHSHPNITMNHVGLYRCSWCSNPSAILRKCSGCGKTRYCDAGCQKSHWADHKKTCTTRSST
ncbi:hypothetical protein BDN72DRAFT_837132 [Pluteus cervinus]|uniref:Uncharacterized protein n=1 Tax=Pluteus cervinus TaxID=181527 RepID=A0ACD3B1M6_9AGAR|nr:hypothetical protein BDN72DRAFT_837132 [Pluteus cervinus]